MASTDAHTGTTTPLDSPVRLSGRVRGMGGVVGAIAIISALGWVVLWRMVSEHAALDGGYETLGPGMAVFDGLMRLLGGGGVPGEGLWSDICRALATGGGPQYGPWPLAQYWIALAMWMVMAVAMMLPTAIPVIATFDDIQGAARAKGLADVPGWMFAAGYLAVWGALAFGAAALQWGITSVLGEEPIFATSVPVIGGALLIAAGLYQWSALKAACLSQCRSPMRFFMTHWRDGRVGAFRMGMRHGIFCVGCCWALMVLMFVGGTMNLVWMAVLTVIMLLEKVLPNESNGSRVFTYGTGMVFVIWGVVLLISGLTQIGSYQ